MDFNDFMVLIGIYGITLGLPVLLVSPAWGVALIAVGAVALKQSAE